MAEHALSRQVQLTLTEQMYAALDAHLFPGDGDEHGAAILAGVQKTPSGLRMLGRELLLAIDGADYVPGERGYRMLRAGFVQAAALRARDERLVYLAIHNHGGRGAVSFSQDDLASQRRGYPALISLTGYPVGALVFSENAVAGNLYLPDGAVAAVRRCTVVGLNRHELITADHPSPASFDPTHDRQALLLGEAGQATLRTLTIGVIGAGGVGSIVIELLARLGVGCIIVADPDRVEPSNLSRLIGARSSDAAMLLHGSGRPAWLEALGRRLARPKVALAARNARRAHPSGSLIPILGDVTDPRVARTFTTCDYLFLAADSMQARLIFNALVHQYLIPGVQMGAKATVGSSGLIGDAYAVCRPLTPDAGCLLCNELIDATKLQEEMLSPEERRVQRYVPDDSVHMPSVISLNAVAAAHAVNDFLFYATGLTEVEATGDYQLYFSSRRATIFQEPAARATCLDCGTTKRSRRAYGDGSELPTRQR